MFMAIVQFPAIKAGKETDFLEWFVWSNDALAGLKGFIPTTADETCRRWKLCSCD